jgi:hypothetical protein
MPRSPARFIAARNPMNPMIRARPLPWILLILALSAGGGLLFHRSFTQAPAAAFDSSIDAALASASRFLLRAQHPDGSFRSDTYGLLKDDLTLTPHVLYTLQHLPQTPAVQGARRRAAARLATALANDPPLSYPVYTLAASISALAQESADPILLGRLVGRLLSFQFDHTRGWSPGDSVYGGWGYNLAPLAKSAHPDPAGPILDANLSATVYALRALRDARLPPDHPAIQIALQFVRTCQNFPTTPGEQANPAFDDGGFFFSPADPSRNKASTAGDRNGASRYRSYGSMTADGLRALAFCNDHSPALPAARQWLRTRFRMDVQPGEFPESGLLYQLGMYYYYLASAAQAAREDPSAAPPDWPRRLAAELLSRQNPDGSWRNPYTDAREDDPLVATTHAALALSLCRDRR